MTDNSYTVKNINRLQNNNLPKPKIYDGGKLFNLSLNLYIGFPLLDKPRNYLNSLVNDNAQIFLIGSDKFIHPENCTTIPVETIIDTVKHSTTGIFCQQTEPNNLGNRARQSLCAASLGLNKNGKNIAAAVLYDPSYGNSTVQKESYYDLLGTLRELYTDLSKSRAVTNFLSDRDSYRYLVSCDSNEVIGKRLPTGTGQNNDNLAESIFRKIQHGQISEKNDTTFDNQIKNLKITRFKLSRFEYLLFSFELPESNNAGKELEYNRLFRCFTHRIKNKLGSLQTASSQLALQAGSIIAEDDIILAGIIQSETEFIDQMMIRTRQLVELEDPEFKQFDLMEIIKEVIASNKEKFDQSVEVTFQSDDNNNCLVFGDTVLLKTALDEIIQNGFETGQDITVDIKQTDKTTITIINKLTDQMYDTLDNKSLDITEPYISLKPNKIGLGLSIASKIISLHDGSIKTELDINMGMITKIILPTLTHPTHHISMEKSRK